MKATIVSHERAPDGVDALEIHRFNFLLDDGQTIPQLRVVSLRTARVLVAELAHMDGFVKMLNTIVHTDAADYDTLPGLVFNDDGPAPTNAGPLQP